MPSGSMGGVLGLIVWLVCSALTSLRAKPDDERLAAYDSATDRVTALLGCEGEAPPPGPAPEPAPAPAPAAGRAGMAGGAAAAHPAAGGRR